jgi:predicted NBD/HSP70 family sugar kinase
MNNSSGSNAQHIKALNRLLVLQLIVLNHRISRVDLTGMTGLSKMTVSNIVSELIASGLVEEAETTDPISGSFGRKPVMIKLALNAPCICGMLIKRGLCQIILASLDGVILEQTEYLYDHLTSKQDLIDMLGQGFFTLSGRTSRRIVAVGISSVGPIDSQSGTILNPPFFYGIENVPISSIIEQISGLPTILVNDANAGALAEKLFGTGRELSNFVYLHIMNGIGAGLVLNDKLYNGDVGKSGEIGHTSINFSGPKCVCGNNGCLDLYANVEAMRARILEHAALYPHSPLANLTAPKWIDIVDAANRLDPLALMALDEFCSYITFSLVNALNLLDLSNIIVGYDSQSTGTIIESILQRKLSKTILSSNYRKITVSHSVFGGNAPLIGAIAEIVDRIFTIRLPLDEIESISSDS